MKNSLSTGSENSILFFFDFTKLLDKIYMNSTFKNFSRCLSVFRRLFSRYLLTNLAPNEQITINFNTSLQHKNVIAADGDNNKSANSSRISQ